MKFNSKIVLSSVATVALFTACGGGSSDNGSTPPPASEFSCETISPVTYKISSATTKTFTEECTLQGQYLEDVTLTADKLWALDGQVRFGGDNKDNVTLTIEPGSVVTGRDGEFLLIARGSKIMAEGTLAEPIVFTADDDVKGGEGFNPASSEALWGGVAIAGNGPVNKADEVTFEFSDTADKFGGSNDADNSGVMKYCVVKYSGFEVRPDEEVQGISLGGVGHGTTLEYISIHNSSDDGIEMWGGSVDVKYLSVTGADDDSIDTDNGYRGNFQYVYVEQHEGKGDRLMEADSDGGNYQNLPVSHPKIANFTFIASGERDATNWREGTRYSLVNGEFKFKKVGSDKAVVQVPDEDAFVVWNGSQPAADTYTNASKFAGVNFFGENISNLVKVNDGETHAADLETYLTTNAVTSKTDASGTATPVSDINAHIADATNADANRYTFENTAQIGFKGPNNTDWRKGWAVDIDGVIVE